MREEENEVQRLILLLKHPDLSRRGEAALALIGLGSKAVEPLLENLRSTDPDMVQWSAAILGQIRDERAIDPMISLMGEADPATRSSIIRALGLIGSGSAVEGLLTALNDPEPRVRSSAALSLGLLKNKEVVRPLIHALSDPSKYVRAQVIWALKEIGDQSALQALTGITNETDPVVQKALRDTITQLQKKGDRSDRPIQKTD